MVTVKKQYTEQTFLKKNSLPLQKVALLDFFCLIPWALFFFVTRPTTGAGLRSWAND